jgi:hypothetical protein
LQPSGAHEIVTDEFDLVVLTQSCDLEQRKVRLAACCPIFSIAEFETANPFFAKKGRWNEVLKGRIEGLHLLASPTNPEKNREALVVDFREIYSHRLSIGTRLPARLSMAFTISLPGAFFPGLRSLLSCELACHRRFPPFRKKTRD